MEVTQKYNEEKKEVITNELESVDGIGPKTKELLEKIQIYTVEDLVEHYPYRYEMLKKSNLQEIKDGDKVVVDGIVEGQPTVIFLSPKLKKIILRINSGHNILNISIYNKVYLIDNLKSGRGITVIGKYDRIKNTIVASDVRLEMLPTIPKIESIYYTTNGLSKKSISKYITSAIMGGYKPKELLPSKIQEKYNLLSKYEAIVQIHNPEDVTLLKKARQRIKYEELFMYLLKINYLKEVISNNQNAIKREIDNKKIEEFIKGLPYQLTEDQISSIKEILNDMESNKQMNRLLQGDVGSGKTIVAFIGTYANYLSGYLTALMVPTEILAKQHYEDAKKIFKDTDMKIELLTSSVKKKDKDKILEELRDGRVDLIIGTQSLIQEDVKFNNLGLVITDEQHRFGVNQRNNLKNKGVSPDVLSMSATPIPRTYALTIYCDMDVSSIKTKPKGRLDVITYFKREKDITSVLEMMLKELNKKHQIYVIAPMIDNDNEEVENVVELEEKMNKAFGKVSKIASIHGKMDSHEKEKIMTSYEKGDIDILISTTVIEVGVNVPNASMIVIFDADLFGLSTIHQLRGRVGRSDIQSYCILIAKEYQERLKFLEKCSDGFEISEYDFKNRGGGMLNGVKQSGDKDLNLKLANFRKDALMLMKARDDVMELLPEILNNKDEYQELYQEITKDNDYNEVRYGE